MSYSFNFCSPNFHVLWFTCALLISMSYSVLCSLNFNVLNPCFIRVLNFNVLKSFHLFS